MARRSEGLEDGLASDAGAQRLDKWLWYARVAKTRTLASGLVVDGKVRVNRQKVSKPAHGVRVGDVVTVSVARGVRVLKIEATGTRRGPATEARTLYEEIVPLPQGRAGGTKAQAAVGQGALLDVQRGANARGERPTKRERRQIDRLKPRFDE